ncbi:hypothetical protein NDU88_000660 [Pleurodeles waltl]|uniref:Uncharacterized protein n=1 Tax=Pleurodeles waltl TaxID=8319 RepID=A0AAV7U4C2_PLEWA|nr:hypothetical protein NDU88_000660 [Pleurodeles waltl]
MGPGPGVRRVRGGLPSRSGWSGAPGRALPSSSLPFPDGPRPGCPGGPGRPPWPHRVVRSPGSGPPACPAPMGPGPGVRGARGGLPGRPGGQGSRVGPSQPALPRWAPAGPPGTPSAPRAPRAKAECVQMGRASPRTRGIWPPSALVCYGASRWPGCPGRPGGQGPRVGPSHPPGCPGPGVWEASLAAPGLRGPGLGPPILQAVLPRWAPAQVSGEASPAVPGVRGPGSGPPSLPCVGGGGSQAERLETFLELWRLTLKRGSLTGRRAVTPRGRRTGGAAFLPPNRPSVPNRSVYGAGWTRGGQVRRRDPSDEGARRRPRHPGPGRPVENPWTTGPRGGPAYPVPSNPEEDLGPSWELVRTE